MSIERNSYLGAGAIVRRESSARSDFIARCVCAAPARARVSYNVTETEKPTPPAAERPGGSPSGRHRAPPWQGEAMRSLANIHTDPPPMSVRPGYRGPHARVRPFGLSLRPVSHARCQLLHPMQRGHAACFAPGGEPRRGPLTASAGTPVASCSRGTQRGHAACKRCSLGCSALI